MSLFLPILVKKIRLVSKVNSCLQVDFCFLFRCTSKNTAVTTSVVGVLKSFIQTTLGMFMFNASKEIGTLGFIGIVINLTFGVYYTYLKYMEKETKKASSDQVISDNNEKPSLV